MNLKQFESLLESINETPVDWSFPDVTILMPPGGDIKQKKPPKKTPDSSKTEPIDPPENPDPSNDNDDSQGGDMTNKVKVGDIIQDFVSGEYGKVTSVDDIGNITWEPASKDELEKEGFLSQRMKF